MLQVSNVSKSFGDNLLFEKVSFTVNAGERAGLIGPNGCGKTTLLKIIVGELPPDTGSAWLSPGDLRAGYLAQALEYEPGQTVGQVLKEAVAGLTGAERRLDDVSARMATAQGLALERLLAEYGRALEAFERLGGYGLEARSEAVLDGLDLRHVDQDTPVEILSGGQKTRLGLARLLLSSPDLLLLDEPTNHLDIEALEWLEGFLQGFRGAVIIVSHDRALLDRTVGTILELDPLARTVQTYPGNYGDYVEAKEREREKHWAAYKEQQEFIAHLQSTLAAKKGYARSIEQGTIDFAPRKIAKGIARKAVVQQRRLERLLDSEERIDRPGRTWQMKLEFLETPTSGRDVLRLEGVSAGYDGQALLRGVDLTLRAGERVALVGANGTGKTTLARLIAGELEPLAGRVRLGAGVKLGYYAQEQEDLDPESTPYETIRAVAAMDETEARTFLHYFLFGGDEAFLPVGSLSFGERARLALARLVAQGCNFLLLDEPVNHLDIPSRSRFEQAMTAFEGTVLAIVHDRYFIDRVATGLWAIEGRAIVAYPDLAAMRRVRQRG
ncbi:MAG: ABC-F family ATP-binding cassette domain-containing protein [Anaerolineae bacterium]